MKILLIALMIIGCGTAQNQKEKSASAKKWQQEKGHTFSELTHPDPSPTPEAESSRTDEGTPVVVVNGPNAQYRGTFEYVATPVEFADAVAKAPAGKRLATKDEVFAMWDQNAFKSTQFTTGAIWTSTAKSGSEIWCMNTFDGGQSSSAMGNKLSAVYVNN